MGPDNLSYEIFKNENSVNLLAKSYNYILLYQVYGEQQSLNLYQKTQLRISVFQHNIVQLASFRLCTNYLPPYLIKESLIFLSRIANCVMNKMILDHLVTAKIICLLC